MSGVIYGSLKGDDVRSWFQTKVIPRWRVYLSQLPPTRQDHTYLLCMLDQAPTHQTLTPDFRHGAFGQFSAEDNVWIVPIRAETTSYIQPCDQSVIGVFKKAIRRHSSTTNAGIDLFDQIQLLCSYQTRFSTQQEFIKCGFNPDPEVHQPERGLMWRRTREFLQEVDPMFE
ncbi:unnamed protein product [Amoebophrya sp. A25]|nr:unnamed protein product [Amoebophrya sp. A25]|eukprot:GSA25T00027072001.1